MSASTLERTARPRRSRTRSRTVNVRPALALSTLKPHQYDLRPACASLVCPDCKTWVPITGLGTKKPKVVSHDTGRAGKDVAVRCRPGSNRLVTVDVRVAKWKERLEDGHAETAHRRKTAVRRKPKVASAPAVAQVRSTPRTAHTARESYRRHLRLCTTCTGTTRCPAGTRLSREVVRLQVVVKERERFDRQYAAQAAADRATAWQPAPEGGDRWTKTAIEQANNLSRRPRPDSQTHYRGPQLPLEPARPTTAR